MHQISVIGNTRACPDELRRQLGGLFEIQFQRLCATLDTKPRKHTLIDIDLRDEPKLVPLKDWLKSKPKDAKVIFVTDRASRLQDMRAYALGATAIVHRPIVERMLLNKLWGEETTLASVGAPPEGEQLPGVAAAVDALQSIFSSACSGGKIDSAAVQAASDAVVCQIEAQGLSP